MGIAVTKKILIFLALYMYTSADYSCRIRNYVLVHKVLYYCYRYDDWLLNKDNNQVIRSHTPIVGLGMSLS